MWTCTNCNATVDDKFENCPQCGTGRDGSEPPVNHVRKKDALQPGLPAAGEIDPLRKNKLIAVSIVIVAILALLFIALGG